MEQLIEQIKKNKIYVGVLALMLFAGVGFRVFKAIKARKAAGGVPGAPGAPVPAAGAPVGADGIPEVKPTVSMNALRPKDIKGGGEGLEEIGSLEIQNKELILKRIKVGFQYDYLSRFNPFRDWRKRHIQKKMMIDGTQTVTGGTPSSTAPGFTSTAVAPGAIPPPGSGVQSPGSTSGFATETEGEMSQREAVPEITFSTSEGEDTSEEQGTTITLYYKGLFGLPRNKIAIIKEKSSVGESIQLKAEGEILGTSGMVIQTINSEKIVLLDPQSGSSQELLLAGQSEDSDEESDAEEAGEAASAQAVE